jgi:HSP20 family protein
MRTLWSPIHDILQRHARLGRAIGQPIVRTWGRSPAPATAMPRLDFAEGPEAFIVRIDLPGVRKDDIDVSVADGNLEVSGQIPTAPDRQDAQVHRSERPSGPFRRVVPLPRQADVEDVRASMADGVLTIRIARRTPDTGRAIPVE